MAGKARPSATQVTPSWGNWTGGRTLDHYQGDLVGDTGATSRTTHPMEEWPPLGFSQVPGYMAGNRGSWMKRADT